MLDLTLIFYMIHLIQLEDFLSDIMLSILFSDMLVKNAPPHIQRYIKQDEEGFRRKAIRLFAVQSTSLPPEDQHAEESEVNLFYVNFSL